ncbi:MAG TPA: hypothetical protein VH079_08425, partial [Terriglobales bacterium]|nr:hypothetical protein [Terriglobales bacterium]
MPRLQKGRLYEASQAFYIQYYRPDGKRVSHRLCSKDQKHYAINARPVKLRRDDFMLKVNSNVVDSGEALVTEFFEKTYTTYMEAELAASTIH